MAGHRPAEAQKYFAELLANYPKAPNIHYLYGSYLLASDPDGGLRESQKELELNPKHAEALVTIAMQYEQRGEPEIARERAEFLRLKQLADETVGK